MWVHWFYDTVWRRVAGAEERRRKVLPREKLTAVEESEPVKIKINAHVTHVWQLHWSHLGVSSVNVCAKYCLCVCVCVCVCDLYVRCKME